MFKELPKPEDITDYEQYLSLKSIQLNTDIIDVVSQPFGDENVFKF